MTKDEIKKKLDLLAEYHAQRDALELHKRELLDEVKIPAEIEALISEGLHRASDIEKDTREKIKAFDAQVDAEIAGILVPDELKTALAEIERQRAEIMSKFSDVEKQRQALAAKKREHEKGANEALSIRKSSLQDEVNAQTKSVYDQVAQRKAEIEAEFSGKADDVAENIAKLEAQIKDDLKTSVKEQLAANPKAKDLSVKGNFFQAVYSKARKSWLPAKLDDYVETHPDIKDCYTEGDPSVAIKRV